MDASRTLLDYLAEPRSSRQLRQRLSLSQPSISRLLKSAGTDVVRIGRGPATRYARAEPVFGIEKSVSLHAVSETGLIEQIATLHTLANGAYVVEPVKRPADFWLLGCDSTGLFDTLPYFIHDMRPAGFLGRQITRWLANAWDAPADPREWNDRLIGRFLLERGLDLPGNLVVGEAAAHRLNRTDVTRVDDRSVEYPRLAQRSLDEGHEPGSSAAGEQPKFAVCQQEIGHVIVKFSPAGETAEAVRWRDLLRAEHHALTRIGAEGLPAAKSALYTYEGRCFLESLRFDRIGERGRRAAISLSMVDAEFAGEGYGWSRVAQSLRGQRLLDDEALRQIAWLEAFGGWIGNSDMHLGNISLTPVGTRFELLPVYDMLPMAFAPARGEVRDVALRPPIRTAVDGVLWRSAGAAAIDFWSAVAADDQISRAFRDIGRELAQRWREVLQ
jgi:HipA-like C-terminal domain